MKSSLENINRLIGEYYPLLHAYYAPPGTGKTLLLLQEAHFAASSTGKTAIYIDTEGGAQIAYNKWHETFNKRFGSADVKIYCISDLRDLLKILGYDVEIATNESVVTFKKVERVSSIFDSFGKNLSIVVLDSLSKVLKTAFATGMQNYAPRAQTINYICTSLATVAYSNRIPVLVSHHATRSIKSTQKPGMYGGDSVKYEFKVVMYMQKKPNHENIVDIYLTRYFDKESWKHKATVMYTDVGVVDVSEQELRKILFGK